MLVSGYLVYEPYTKALCVQVHEKSILMPMLPMALLHAFEPRVSTFMLLLAPFSMFPLLLKDGQALPYAALAGCVAIAAPDITNAWSHIVAHACGEGAQAVDDWDKDDAGTDRSMHVAPVDRPEEEEPAVQNVPEPSDDSQVSSATQVPASSFVRFFSKP